MATRFSKKLRHVMWDMTRLRIRNILNYDFGYGKVSDYVTSVLGVAMLLRWHIKRPGSLFNRINEDNGLLDEFYGQTVDTSAQLIEREERILIAINDKASSDDQLSAVSEIYTFKKVPDNDEYSLDLLNSNLSDKPNSFILDQNGLPSEKLS
jgi:hypothetical protein